MLNPDNKNSSNLLENLCLKIVSALEIFPNKILNKKIINLVLNWLIT